MRTNAVLAERLCEAKYSELYLPEGALIKRWASPVCKCALPTSEDLYLDSEKGMMVLSRGAAPLFLGVEHRGQYEPPQRTEKADVGSRTRTGCVDGTPAVPSRSSDGS